MPAAKSWTSLLPSVAPRRSRRLSSPPERERLASQGYPLSFDPMELSAPPFLVPLSSSVGEVGH